MKTIRKFQKGLSLVTAIFLLVVLAGLGAVMMTFFTAQQQSTALDIMGTRAYQAAKAGIEWGAYQVLLPIPPSGGPPNPCFTSPTTLPALGGSLSGFTVRVTCSRYTPIPADQAISAVYSLQSTATQGQPSLPDYVERQVSATFAQ